MMMLIRDVVMSFNIYKKCNNTVSIHLPVKILACQKEGRKLRKKGSWKCYKRGWMLYNKSYKISLNKKDVVFTVKIAYLSNPV